MLVKSTRWLIFFIDGDILKYLRSRAFWRFSFPHSERRSTQYYYAQPGYLAVNKIIKRLEMLQFWLSLAERSAYSNYWLFKKNRSNCRPQFWEMDDSWLVSYKIKFTIYFSSWSWANESRSPISSHTSRANSCEYRAKSWSRRQQGPKFSVDLDVKKMSPCDKTTKLSLTHTSYSVTSVHPLNFNAF